MFPNNFIHDNPQLFLGTEWVQIDQLKVYLQKQGVSRDSPFVLRSSSPLIPPATRQNDIYHAQTRVKQEVFDSKTTIKSEDTPLNLTVPSARPVKTRLFTQGDQEVIKILSSDEEMDDTVDDDVLDMISEAERDSSYEAMSEGDLEDDGRLESEIMSIPTDWNDPSTKSHVIYEGKPTDVTLHLKVEHVELLESVPSLWPVPRVPTAYIVDLRHGNFDFQENGKVITIDGLIKNKVYNHFRDVFRCA
jgi:hypothetical protein